MIICVDCDGVLNNLTERVLEIYNERTSKDIRISDITDYNFYDCLPKEDAYGIIELFKEKELWDSLTPSNDSPCGIKTLIQEGHRIIIATATNPINFQWKVEWIKKYYPFINPDDIIRITDKSLLKCDVMIDDYLENLISNICERIVINKPWNQDKNKTFAYDIYRANNFKDVINIINDIERKDREWEMNDI